MIGLPMMAGGGPPKPPRAFAGGEDAPRAAAKPVAAGREVFPDEIGYVGADMRCKNCTHFGKDSQCARYGFACEPDGGCPRGFSPRMDEEPAEMDNEGAYEPDEQED